MQARRDFLTMLAGLATNQALKAFSGVVEGDRYVNSRLGLEFSKPPSWHFVSVVDFSAVRLEQKMSYSSDEIEEVFKRYEHPPSLVVTKYPVEHDELNPNFMLWVDPLDADTKNLSMVEYLDLFLKSRRHVFADVWIDEKATEISLPGVTEAAQARFRYNYQHVDGRCMDVESHSILLLRGNTTHILHMIQGMEAPARAEAEFRTLLKSIRYTT